MLCGGSNGASGIVMLLPVNKLVLAMMLAVDVVLSL